MRTYTKFKEYIWLVNTIYHAKAITLAEINRRWLQTEMSEGVELARSTFHRHKNAIEDIFGIFIDCDKKNGNKYFIGNEQVLREDSIQNWMLSTLSVSNVVSESQSLHRRILLENVPSGGELLQQVIDAMKGEHLVSITYRRYGADTHTTFTLAPYCVKLFHQRWYLLGQFTDSGKLGVFAFDRRTLMPLTTSATAMGSSLTAAWRYNASFCGHTVQSPITCAICRCTIPSGSSTSQGIIPTLN